MKFLGKKQTEHRIEQIPVQYRQLEKLEIPDGPGLKAQKIYSPTAGKIIPLQQVSDEVFKNDIVGKGIGILPDLSAIYSPVNGVVKYIPKTKHAVLILSNDGMHVLIHIGLDTVNLKGQFFKSIIKVNDKVKVGEVLIQFNLKAIEDLGFSTVIPVVVTNSDEYSRIEVTNKEIIGISDCLMNVFM